MGASDREFREAIECFKVIETCLRSFYFGEIHMYRPLSAQLRMLLCDTNRRKDNSLITRLFKSLQLTPLKEIIYREHGTFGEDVSWVNMIRADSDNPDVSPKLALMPFEITVFSNGFEIGDLLLEKDGELLSISDWLDQNITIHPVPITIRSLIKTVADRGGGAHVHHTEDQLLDTLSKYTATEAGIDALFTVAIARITQQLGWRIIQFYEKCGANGNFGEFLKEFDDSHESVVNSAKIPEFLYQDKRAKYCLMSVVGGIFGVR